MPIRPCPKCENPTVRELDALNKFTTVNYYRCAKCGHIWNLPKDGSSSTPRDVTKD